MGPGGVIEWPPRLLGAGGFAFAKVRQLPHATMANASIAYSLAALNGLGDTHMPGEERER